jgi:hypothetical protein
MRLETCQQSGVFLTQDARHVKADLCEGAWQTAGKYLNALAKHGSVEKHRFRKRNYFINVALVKLFLDVSESR